MHRRHEGNLRFPLAYAGATLPDKLLGLEDGLPLPMIPSSPITDTPRRRVPSIRRALLLQFAALIVFAFAVFSAGLYFLIVKPATREIAAREMDRATTEVESEFKALVGQSERVLGTARDWGKDGQFDLFDAPTFNRLFMPIIGNRPLVTSVYVADEGGRMVLLERMADGGWNNRLSDPGKWGNKRRQLTWGSDPKKPREEWLDGDYDPRVRPWYVGVLSLARMND